MHWTTQQLFSIGFFGLLVGFISGVFLACAHPIVLKHYAEAREAKESLEGTRKAIKNMQDIIAKAKKA